MGSHISCPLCRAQLPDGLYQYVYANASHLSSMARRHKDKKAHYSALARKELNAFIDKAIVSPELMTLNAELLEIEESYPESIEASLAILEMPNLIEVLTRTNLTNIIKCHMAQHHYRDAMKYIKDLFKIADDPVKYAYDVRFLFHKASECMYELGSYQESINFGMAAIESNRHYEDVHRCVALSHDALGQYEEAILTMRRAVRYETPWDSAHTQVCQELLDRLVRENEARIASRASRVEEITESVAGASI
jgi:tetratricopeptide (TPR) repeat protein